MGGKINANLNWQCQVNGLSVKLNRANAVLFKIRKYISSIRSIYFAIFESHLIYCSLVWSQNFIQEIVILQKNVARIISFQPRNLHASPLFKQSSILKFQDKIYLENILFVSKSVSNLTSSVFNTWFSFSLDQRNYETSSSRQGNLTKFSYRTNRYRKYSIIASAVDYWNKILRKLKNTLLKDLSLNNIKTFLSNFYIKSY